MASSTQSSSEEQFLCSICLEVFSEPVSTPCGHNFCKRCISQTWDTNESCFCPLCKEVFSTRPQLKKNTFISEMVSQWKLEEERRSKRVSKPVEVQCDFCSEPKLKAVKSCLVCLSSFCDSHLQPHLTVSGLKRHQLMEPVDDLEDRMCPTHDRLLELYCSTDQKTICMMCSVLEHKNHTLVPLKEAFEQEKVSLQQTVAENQHLKQVHDTEVKKKLPDSPQRFTLCAGVLGKQSFSSGRFYFEVQVKGKTEWDLGVAREPINRTGLIYASPKNGFWTIWFRDGEYKALDDPGVPCLHRSLLRRSGCCGLWSRSGLLL
uniref:Uncharacterized protein n=1 Tax=Neogobius melanostomus TaxID=47308 RepID=A0A8C6TCD0_9GOBI